MFHMVQAERGERVATEAPRRPRALYWVVASGIAAVLLYLSLRGIDWKRVWQLIRGASPSVLGIVLTLMSVAMFLRAMRWRVLLSAGGKVRVPLAFRATAAGYLGNNLLPARAGELVRTLMVSRQAGLSTAFVLTTALSERVADAIALIAIGATVLLAYPAPPEWFGGAVKVVAGAALCGAAAIALVPVFEKFYLAVLARVPLPHRLQARLRQVLVQVIAGMRSFHERRRFFRFLGLTAVIWCMDALGAVLCAASVGLPLSFPVAFLLLAGMGLGSALPATPGYVGIYQFVAATVLIPFGTARSDAIAFSLVLQASGVLVILFWGLTALSRRPRI
jgi:uncharacterized protein (TIRG00374 family)